MEWQNYPEFFLGMHERENLRSTRLALIEFFLKKLRVFLLI